MTGKRIFVRGLPKETTEESLASRFAGFGFVSNVSIARDGFAGKECRGFGHLTIDIDDGAWKKCMSLLNGSKWKGMKIQISEAKPRYNDIMKTGDENPVQKPLRRLVRHASDMTLVNDDDSKKRKGWRRSQFGRLIAVVKIRKPNGELVVMDPSHHKDALTRFYTGTRQKPIESLTLFYEGTSKEPVYFLEEINSGLQEDSVKGQSSDDDFNSSSTMDNPADNMLEVQQTTEMSRAWEEVSGGQTFSLATCLSLPKVEVNVTPVANHLRKNSTEKITDNSSTLSFELKDLFFDFSTLLNNHSDVNCLFVPKGSKLESMTVWKGNRSEIRKDFKKQSKEAKRFLKKKISHLRTASSSTK